MFASIADHGASTSATFLLNFPGLWEEVGSELLLLALFCAGFSLFRITAVRRLFPGGVNQRSFKARAPKVLEDDPNETQFQARSSETGRDPVKHQRRGGEIQSRSSATPKSRSSETPKAWQRRVDSTEGFVHSDSVIKRWAATDEVGKKLEACRKEGDLEQLHKVCLEISGGSVIPNAPCESLLRTCAAVGDSNSVEVFDVMVGLGYEPTDSTAITTIALCADSRHVRLAEHLVGWSRNSGRRVTLSMYSALIKVYCQAKLWHKTCDLFHRMKEEGVVLDTVAYGSLIKAAVESGRNDLAQQLFKESGNPDLLNYMSLIRAAGREGDVGKALRLLSELEASPLSADSTAYNCALESCVACNDRASADDLFRRMVSSGRADVVSYNTYLKLLLSVGAREEVALIFRQMRAAGLCPSVVTYNSLIRDAVCRQDLARAWGLVDTMYKVNVMPDAFTCSILMKGVKHAPETRDVDKILDLIRNANVTPDEVLVNCVLDACVRLRDTDRLTSVLERFRSTGVVPSLHAYATLIRAYGHARCADKAWELWREVTACGEQALANEETFVAMVDACLACGDLQGALSVFRQPRKRLQEFARVPSVFAGCVKACFQQKQHHRIFELYNETRSFFTCGRVTYNTIIDAFVRAGDVRQATSVFTDMTIKNVKPDVITYSTLVKGHCNQGDLEQALALLGQMQRRGVAPDAVLFNSILDGCARKQMRTLTEQVLQDMETCGVAPSNFTLSILAKLYGRCGDVEAAFRAAEVYPKKFGFQVNAQVFTSLMAACITNGDISRAIEVYKRMAVAGAPPDAKTFQTLLGGTVKSADMVLTVKVLRDSISCGFVSRIDGEVLDAALLFVRRSSNADECDDESLIGLMEELLAAGANLSERATRQIRGKGPQAKSWRSDDRRSPSGSSTMSRRSPTSSSGRHFPTESWRSEVGATPTSSY